MGSTQVFGPYTISPGASWYLWFNPAAIPDNRLRYCVAREVNPVVGGVVTSEVWIPAVYNNAAGGWYWSYRILVENRNSATAWCMVAVYTFD
jgi:hypothetical protein